VRQRRNRRRNNRRRVEPRMEPMMMPTLAPLESARLLDEKGRAVCVDVDMEDEVREGGGVMGCDVVVVGIAVVGGDVVGIAVVAGLTEGGEDKDGVGAGDVRPPHTQTPSVPRGI
jgi:hypothetical protein